jgi:hypothetical protein
MISTKIRILLAGTAASAVSMAGLTMAGAVQPTNPGNSNPHDSVTLCHATGSSTHPYQEITVNANGSVSGHDNHSRDIIPPFDYNSGSSTAHYSGKNWTTANQATLNNHCVAVTGGSGGGGGGGEVLGASTGTPATGGSGGGGAGGETTQVEAPVGSVNAGEGGAPSHFNTAAAIGLGSSSLTVAGGLVLMRKLFLDAS